VDGAVLAESIGFDSVWVRDHLIYVPANHEDADITHVDAFVTLGAIASATTNLSLGTATLIPHRHPVLTAVLIGSLDHLAGPDRVLVGWGIGSHDREFSIVGMDGWDRREVLHEQVQVIRRLLAGESVSHRGTFYNLDGVQLRPAPGPDRQIPMWYGGASVAGVRRAAASFDGWIAARIPRRSLISRIQRLHETADALGRPRPEVAVIPYVVLGKDRASALRRVDLPSLCADTARRYAPPASGSFETLDDLDGAVIAGSTEDVAEGVRLFHDAGARHVVFDLRLQFDAWLETVQRLGEEVLPRLQGSDGRSGLTWQTHRN
jgi:alkanesulfonate monooxygenase SsuD/methylene tetrahydromethanopterin reductase-like flavin-dependent oxidoreductase (luciferase family)